MGNPEYLFVLGGFLLAAIFLEKKFHIHLYRNRKERVVAALVFFTIGIVWDTFATWRGHWIFPQENTLGIRIGLLPIEEYLFFLILPFLCITIYKVVDNKFVRVSVKKRR